MRLLFAYDHRFRHAPDGRVWTTGALSASVWKRYLKVFDHVQVLGRDGGEGDEADGLSRSDSECVSFVFADDLNSPTGTFRRPRVMRKVEELVAASDAVVARLPSEFGLLACAAAGKLNKPYLVEVVGSAFDSFAHHGSLLGKLYAPFVERRVRRAVAKAPFVVYVTESWLQNRYPSKHPRFVADNEPTRTGLQVAATDALLHLPGSDRVAGSVTNAAVVLPKGEVQESRQHRLASLRAGRDPVLGTIGSLATRHKGIQVALPALAQLKKEGFGFTYRILGGGDREPWQRLIDDYGLADRCFLDGVLPSGPRVLEWLDQLDIYLQPSLTEALPRAILEAMSRGVCCIGSSVGGIPELISPKFLHEPGDSRQLAEDLRRLLTDPNEVERLSAFSFEQVANYAPEIVEGKREAMLRILRGRAEHQGGALFVHDHMFRYSRTGEVWTSGAHSAGLWQRYLSHFKHLTVIGRDGGFTADSPAFARADADGVSFRLLANVNGLREVARRAHVRSEIEKAVRSADAVIARLPSEFGLMACAAARRLQKPYMVEVVGSAFDSLSHHGSWLGRAYAPIAERRVRRAVAKAPFVNYVTQRWLQRLYPSSNPSPGNSDCAAQSSAADVVVQLPDQRVRERREDRLRRLEDDAVPVFATVASLGVRYKGLQFAIPAFARLRAEGYRFVYRILGSGNPEPWQKLINDHGLGDCCFLDPPIPAGSGVWEWLDGIDVHVQPSVTESLGRANIEAMSRGVACISSNAGGLGEYVDPDWMHAPGDIDVLTDQLRRLMEDRRLIRRLSEYSFETVQRFDPAALDTQRSQLMALLAAKSASSQVRR